MKKKSYTASSAQMARLFLVSYKDFNLQLLSEGSALAFWLLAQANLQKFAQFRVGTVHCCIPWSTPMSRPSATPQCLNSFRKHICMQISHSWGNSMQLTNKNSWTYYYQQGKSNSIKAGQKEQQTKKMIRSPQPPTTCKSEHELKGISEQWIRSYKAASYQ